MWEKYYFHFTLHQMLPWNQEGNADADWCDHIRQVRECVQVTPGWAGLHLISGTPLDRILSRTSRVAAEGTPIVGVQI